MAGGNSKASKAKTPEKKKDIDSDGEEDTKPKTIKKSVKAEVLSVKKDIDSDGEEDMKPKTTKKSVKTEVLTVTVKKIKKAKGGDDSDKRGKKNYSLPGQKHDPPQQRDPLRIFYESLHEQIPSGEMAEVWMLEHGLLSLDKAKKAYERKQKRLQQAKVNKSNKKRVHSDEDNDEMIKPKKRPKRSS